MTPYQYCPERDSCWSANNPLKFVDPEGLDLTAINTGTQWILVDKKIAANVVNAINEARREGIPIIINSHFRTEADQQLMVQRHGLWNGKTGAARPRTSRHESGFAIDFNTSHLTKTQKEKLKKILNKYGLMSPLPGEPWHFEADPTSYGYSTRKAAIKENNEDFKEDAGENQRTHSNNGSLMDDWQRYWDDYWSPEHQTIGGN